MATKKTRAAAALADAVIAKLPFPEDNRSLDRTFPAHALHDAVLAVAKEMYVATDEGLRIPGERGIFYDNGLHCVPPEATEKVTKTTLTFANVEPILPSELAKREERMAAYFWRPEDGPPPKQVSTLQLLDQGTWWMPNEGPPIKIEDMDPSYRINLTRWLFRRAELLKNREVLSLLTGPQPSGDMACDAFDGMVSQIEESNAKVWLRETELMRKLLSTQKSDKKRTRAASLRNPTTGPKGLR
jgi:hypothetical protein